MGGVATAGGTTTTTAAGDLWVSPSGDDINPGSEAEPLKNLLTAIGRVAPGNTIWMTAGTHSYAARNGINSETVKLALGGGTAAGGCSSTGGSVTAGGATFKGGSSANVDPKRYRIMWSSDFPPIPVTNSDPDDVQTVIRLILYSNELTIEGFIASAGTYGMVANKSNFDPIWSAYEKVYPNLQKHDPKYPTPAAMRAMTFEGKGNNSGVNIKWECNQQAANERPGSLRHRLEDLIRELLLRQQLRVQSGLDEHQHSDGAWAARGSLPGTRCLLFRGCRRRYARLHAFGERHAKHQQSREPFRARLGRAVQAELRQ